MVKQKKRKWPGRSHLQGFYGIDPYSVVSGHSLSGVFRRWAFFHAGQ